MAIKKEPYEDGMILLGQQTVYPGKPVYTAPTRDGGKVVYGWLYPTPITVNSTTNKAGFWVGEQVNNSYQLAQKNMLLGSKIHGNRTHGTIQCYPCWAEIVSNQGQNDTGKLYFPVNNVANNVTIGCFDFTGGVCCMSSDGKVLIYDNFYFDLLQAGQQKQLNGRDLFIATISIYDDSDNMLDTGSKYTIDTSNNTTTYYIYDNSDNLVATYSNGQVNCGQYTGDGKIIVINAVAYYETTTIKHIDLQLLINENNVIKFVDYFDNNNTRIIGGMLQTYDARRMLQLAKIVQNGIDAYITAETPDRTQQGDILYTGNFEVFYELSIASGNGIITVDSSNVIHIYDNNMNEIYRASGNLLFSVTNGAQQFIGYGRCIYDIDSGDYDMRLYINGRQGVAYLTYVSGKKHISDAQGNLIAKVDSNNYLHYYYGGSLSVPLEWTGPGSITTSMESAVEYVGDWSIILTGSGRVTDPYADMDITDGTLHIAKNGGTISIDDSGNSVYSGPGTITLTNLQDIGGGVYTADYVVELTGSGKVESTDLQSYCIVYDGNTYVAEYSQGHVNFASGYSLRGRIATYSLTATKWSCGWELDATLQGQATIWTHNGDTYCEVNNTVVAYEDGEDIDVNDGTLTYSDAGHIETSNTSVIKSVKSYEITNAVQEQNYPQTWAIGDNTELILPSMNLRFGQQTVSGDVLGVLSPTSWTTWPGGVHANGTYVISQDGQKIWHNTAKTYAGIENCFNLAWLTKKWK